MSANFWAYRLFDFNRLSDYFFNSDNFFSRMLIISLYDNNFLSNNYIFSSSWTVFMFYLNTEIFSLLKEVSSSSMYYLTYFCTYLIYSNILFIIISLFEVISCAFKFCLHIFNEDANLMHSLILNKYYLLTSSSSKYLFMRF